MPCLVAPPYDIVLVVLDDMRADQLDVLEETLQRLEPNAVRFDRAYVTTPMCCPERASFLSGGWLPQDVGVITNTAPMGGATVFYDERTLATRLQSAGYTTALIGKYINQYKQLGTYIPPGWSQWAATYGADGWTAFNTLVGSSTATEPGEGALLANTGYLTDWAGEAALRVFEARGEAPLFLYLALDAPHDPHTPDPQDALAFPDFVYRGGAYEEEDLSDKPTWIAQISAMGAEEEEARDRVNRQRQQTLLAADRAIAALIDAVAASDRADRAVFIVTSDNGLMWREHRLTEKGVAYEESVRVPLLIAAPGPEPGRVEGLVAMNLDLAATVAALAGLEPEGQGQSLLTTLCAGADTGRDAVVLQAWNGAGGPWSGVVTATEKLILSVDGQVELYDLLADPYEMSSLHANSDWADRRDALIERVAAEEGLAIVQTAFPDAMVGQPYSAQVQTRGGEGPRRFSLLGALPPGMLLDSEGFLRGSPTTAGRYTVEVQVHDSGSSPVHGGPQRVRAELTLVVRPCSCADGRALLPGLLLAGLRRSRRRPPCPA